MDVDIKPLDVALSNIFRRILIEEIDSIFDEEIMEVLERHNKHDLINRFNKYKRYGKHIIKREREY